MNLYISYLLQEALDLLEPREQGMALFWVYKRQRDLEAELTSFAKTGKFSIEMQALLKSKM